MEIEDLFKKKFYAYYMEKLNREKPLDYIFFDWKVFFLLIFVFVIGLALFLPQEFILVIPVLKSQSFILESILRTVSIFIGISFSFIILSFNIFYKYFGRYAFLDFFKSRSAKICFTLLTSTVALLIYSVSFINEVRVGNSYTNFLFIFSITLSITSSFSIFPCLIYLLRSSQNRKHILRLFEKLNEDWVINEFVAKMENQVQTFYQKDPINILNEIGLAAIKDYDNYTLELITDNINSFFETNIKNKTKKKGYIDFQRIYNKFDDLLSNYYHLSVKEKNENLATSIVYAQLKLEYIVINNIEDEDFNFLLIGKKYKFWNLNFTLEKFFKKAIQFNEDEVAKEILSGYNSFITNAIVKLYPENINYITSNRIDVITKSEIVTEPLGVLSKFAEILISSKKVHLFTEIFNTYYCVELKILELNTTNSTKCLLLNIVHNYKENTFQDYIELSEVKRITYLNFPFKHSATYYQKIDCKIPFLGSLNILDLLFAVNKLNAIAINQICIEIAMILQEKKNYELVEKGIEKLIDISKKIKDSDGEEKKDIYLKLLDNLKKLYQDAIDYQVVDTMKEKLKNAVESFESEAKFKQELKDNGYIRDERFR
ncbi:hypothetical protein FNO01nite_14050 [Flavobacterium noncentrifugens]|uniref:DUF2254 domain-containing protein n=1 Tax=Flavobacterium noncentrifugens TaxID=1128970 RepID=A0A1G8W171_9FLAO|nr:hypothetical protein [Flavobacterium noncentrifugens]GEP50733.1 hypothetical protein FNO01nite_14050 [Flavobacterium noncentrifugens]SDJ72072.1 hypothetical protein SAMN04487935_1607 [Flavobacterium noncentrifugens]